MTANKPIILKLKPNEGNQDEEVMISENGFIEDAIFSIAGLMPKIYNCKKVKLDQRIPIGPVLDYIEFKIDQNQNNHIFKQRYCSLIDRWIDDIGIQPLLGYLKKVYLLLIHGSNTNSKIVIEAICLIRNILISVENQRS